MNKAIALHVDARQLSCPMPLLKAKQGLNKTPSGELVEVLTSDPQSLRDFQAFARLSGNILLEYSENQGVFCFVLRKA